MESGEVAVELGEPVVEQRVKFRCPQANEGETIGTILMVFVLVAPDDVEERLDLGLPGEGEVDGVGSDGDAEIDVVVMFGFKCAAGHPNDYKPSPLRIKL